MDASLIASIITGVSSALITAYVTKSTSDKKHSVENITQERKKWRDEMREATLALRFYFEHRGDDSKENLENSLTSKVIFHSAVEAKSFFQVRLNPSDPEDEKIMDILCNLVNLDFEEKNYNAKCLLKGCQIRHEECKQMSKNISDFLCRLEFSMAKLMKYEWEKAKREVKKSEVPKILVFLGITLPIAIYYVQHDIQNIVLNIDGICTMLKPIVAGGVFYGLCIVMKRFLITPISRCFWLCKLFDIPNRK